MDCGPWIGIDWRERQRWVGLREGMVNVIELGEGPPVVFIHGLGGSWQNWLEQLPVFAERHRVVAFDLPGFGASPMPEGRISIGGYVQTSLALLEALGIERAALVGNSMGGLIAAELALAAPGRVSHLALISPAGVPVPVRAREVPVLRALYPVVALGGRWISAHAEEIVRRARLRNLLLGTVAHRPERLPAELAAEQLRGMGKPGLWPAFEDLVAHSVSERLAAISCPTLIVWGERDHVLPAHHADVFAAAIPGARKVVYPDTAHVAMFERPREVNALLAELFATEPREGPHGRPADERRAQAAREATTGERQRAAVDGQRAGGARPDAPEAAREAREVGT
jgi:pimeloyl-ACP methyl ester carboxylesterase